jgi:hypothetical protein
MRPATLIETAPHPEFSLPRITPPQSATGTPFRQIMSMRPEIAEQWFKLDETVRFSGLLPPALKEEVRRTLADAGGCAFCSSLGKPANSHADPRLAAAVAFAAQIAANPGGISDQTWAAVRAVFSDLELVELCAWICLMYGSEMFGALMRLDPATPAQLAAYGRWLEAGGAKYRQADGT